MTTTPTTIPLESTVKGCTCGDGPGPMPTGIASKIAQVMAAARRVREGGRNRHGQGGGYSYARNADICEELRPLIGQAGLAIIPTIEEATPIEGGGMRVRMSYTILADNPVESWGPVPWYGEVGKTDKALAKAITAAGKSFRCELFLVSTGDDPEAADDPPDDRPQGGEAQSRGRPDPVADAIRKQIGLTATKKTIPMEEFRDAAKGIGHDGPIDTCTDVGKLRAIKSYVDAYVPTEAPDEGTEQ